MLTPPIPPAADGFYHPSSEDDVIALVRFAAANGLQVRTRGAGHSVGWSIFTDPVGGVPANQTLEATPPAGANIDIALDRMIALDWIDANKGIVEVEAGCHLGHDTNDPFGASTLENSFLYQAFQKGWAVDNLGGITHQTIGGFTGTGSAGGSTRHSFSNMTAFRVVDGLGNASWIEAGDEAFGAMLTSMGLLGIVTRVRFQLVPMYNIRGDEVTTSVGGEDCPMDFFGSGGQDRPSLREFLLTQDYTRLTWSPQPGMARLQTWRASRVPAGNDDLEPYREFPDSFAGWTEQLLGAALFVLVGNSDKGRIAQLLKIKTARYSVLLARMSARQNLGGMKRSLLAAGGAVAGGLVRFAGGVLASIGGASQKLYQSLLPRLDPISKGKMLPGFYDWYWRSLCMDNTADDILMSTEFTEIWVPIQHSGKVVNLLQAMLDKNGYAASGWFALELYAGPPSAGWLNPGYTDGTDDYKDGTIRLDVYWYSSNEGMPNMPGGFFEQYWELLKANGIPFRLHWGKYVPAWDLPGWAAYYRASLPKFDDFMALRAQRDPAGVFFTQYWQSRLLGTESPG